MLYLAGNRLISKTLGAALALTAFMMLITLCCTGTVLAGGVGDVVTEVVNANFSSTDFDFSRENKTGYNFPMYMGGGKYANDGVGIITVLGPVKAGEIDALVEYVDSVAQRTSIETTRMKGCELREYTMERGMGVSVVLPDFFITVELYETGNSNTSDLVAAKKIAQQTLDRMERAGLLSQAAPDIEKPVPKNPDTSAVEKGKALAEPIFVSNTMNIAAVKNGPTVPTTFSINRPHLVSYMLNYHWNNARGANPGTIALQDSKGKIYGPWPARGTPGQGGVPNANWEVSPNIVIPAGTYTVIDSDPATWSCNADSGGRGMGEVKATPHFEVSGSIEDLNKGTPGSSPGGWAENPAGVGSVGNIPGPDSTTEAVVGVAVPGLIASIFGALAGLGGGGGPVTPGGSPFYGGGPSRGPFSGTGNTRPGAAREVSQLGSKRRETEIYASDPATDPVIPEPVTGGTGVIGPQSGMIIDTADMLEAPIAVQPEPEVIIDTADEVGIFIQPEPEIHIDTVDMQQQAIDVRGSGPATDHGMIIDTTEMLEGNQVVSNDNQIFIETQDEASIIAQPEPEVFIATNDMHEQAMDFREPGGEPGINIDTTDMFEESPAAEISGYQGMFTETEDEAALFTKSGSDLEMEAESVKPQAFNAREGEAEGAHFAAAENSQGASAAAQSEHLFSDTGDSEILLDNSSLEDSAGNETVSGSEAATATGAEAQGAEQTTTAEATYDQYGFNAEGYDRDGYNRYGFNAEGYDKHGFNAEGFNQEGYDRAGFDKEGFDRQGFDKEGFDKAGFGKDGFDKAGFNAEGYDKQGFDKLGFNKEGYNRDGFNKAGYDQEGFGHDGYDAEGFNRQGYNKQGFNQAGFDKEGFDRQGLDKEGFNRAGFDKEGFDKAGFDAKGYDREGFNKAGFDKEGFDRDGFDQSGFDREGFNQAGFDAKGYDREGFNKAGFDKEGFDRDGFDREGYGRNGFDSAGFDREGYDVNGYDRKGFNRSGFDAQGYDKQGYDKEGFNKEGWDREGYDHNGFDENGWDREGYDKNGYDAEGYDRDGYNREGQSKEGYDADGYDKKGFNEHGYDRDGYDREGFDFAGYNRSGYDPWGYNRQGYDRDGYHWSGYNADGYNREGMHWTDNPYEADNSIDRESYNPFEDGLIVDLGGRKEAWQPTKPPLGEPYHRTVEKYGAKPWTDEMPQPKPEKPTIPSTEDTGVIGSEDPDAGNIPPDTIPDVPPVSGPQHGDTITLPGKDGRDYQLEYNSQTGEWENLLTGGRIRNEDLGSYVEDFNRWQDDVAEDLSRSARDIEKMAAREDATSQAIDKNLADWKRLEQMQKMADKYNIGEPGGPGDIDKAIQNLKDDMLAGKEIDQGRLEQLNKIIDHRIQGTTAADTGQRWEEDWFKNLGWALEANVATTKEVITGEKADGSTSWLGMGARIMITAASGGLNLTTVAGNTVTSAVLLDGALTISEAMFRIQDSINKGESDFKAISQAIGLTVLGEEIGWLAGTAGSTLNKAMLERFPVFTNKTADFIEKSLLNIMKADQISSQKIRMVSKESAEEMLKEINKRLTELSGKTTEEAIEKAAGKAGRGAGRIANLTKETSKAFSGGEIDFKYLDREIEKATSKSIEDVGTKAFEEVFKNNDKNS